MKTFGVVLYVSTFLHLNKADLHHSTKKIQADGIVCSLPLFTFIADGFAVGYCAGIEACLLGGGQILTVKDEALAIVFPPGTAPLRGQGVYGTKAAQIDATNAGLMEWRREKVCLQPFEADGRLTFD